MRSKDAVQPRQQGIVPMPQDAYWIPSNSIDEARLVRVLAEMVRYFLATHEGKESSARYFENEKEIIVDQAVLEPEVDLQLAA